MATIGVFAAKEQLSALLERAARGEEIVITKHGRPMARLVSAQAHDRERAVAAAQRIKELARSNRLDGLTIRALRDEGRA